MADTEIDAKILEKIQQIRAMADPSRNPSEGEVQAAAGKLSRLLLKYNLSMSSLDEFAAKRGDGDVTNEQVDIGSEEYWQLELLGAIALNNLCRVIRYIGQSVIIVGHKRNIDAVMQIFNYLRGEVSAMAVDELEKARKEPNSEEEMTFGRWYVWNAGGEGGRLARTYPSKWLQSFRLGMIRGIHDRMQSERRKMEWEETSRSREAQREAGENTERAIVSAWSIIPTIEREVDDYLNENFTVNRKPSQINIEHEVFSRGRDRGYRIQADANKLGG